MPRSLMTNDYVIELDNSNAQSYTNLDNYLSHYYKMYILNILLSLSSKTMLYITCIIMSNFDDSYCDIDVDYAKTVNLPLIFPICSKHTSLWNFKCSKCFLLLYFVFLCYYYQFKMFHLITVACQTVRTM